MKEDFEGDFEGYFKMVFKRVFNPVQFMSLFGHALFNYNPPKQGRKVW